VRLLSARSLRILTVVLGCAGCGFALYTLLHWRLSEGFPERRYDLATGEMAEWKAYGGSWEIADGSIHNNSDERGAKLLTGYKEWTNYTLTADVRFDGEHGDMGMTLRSNDEEEGVDAYNGYYVGLRTTDGTLIIGRSDYGWEEAPPLPMPGGVHASTWYRLKATAYGCDIAASAQNLSTLQTAWIAFEELPCVKSGRIGLRSLSTGGMWRNISVSPAALSDYQELRRNAKFVEHPEFPKREADYNRVFRIPPPDSAVAQPSGWETRQAAPESHIGDLQNIPRMEGEDVTLRGVVVLTSPDLYVQDSTGGILVRDSQIPPLNVGDAIELMGHAQPSLYSAEISKVAVRLLWSGSPVPPIVVTPSQAASGAYDSRFVETEGRFIGMEPNTSGDQVLEFTQGGQSFRAIYAGRRASSLNQPEKNSYLRVRGVCVLDRKYTQDRVPFVVLIRSADDLRVLEGPPWWTPWHIGMLGTCIIALTLLIQLVYFRIAQWKAHAITLERNRLAHEIHDTMAQSFAGIGYQIQGIRSGILRGENRDSRFFADQLSVTYQLVRRCHEEASRTISMMGSSTPQTENNLLGGLADTARRIAGDQIRTVTALQGAPFPLSIRLTDALLHIGQEAIANAVTHANPTVLHVTLRYEANGVELLVEDDGQGFDCQLVTAGFGILGMQKRVRHIGGTLNINSVPGRGTQVRVNAKDQTISLPKKILEKVKKSLSLKYANGMSRAE
jgi:hypothetical protein